MTSVVPSAIEEITRIAGELGLTPAVTAEAILAYHKMYNEQGNWNRSVEVNAGTAVLIGCRMTGAPRTAKQVAKASRVPSKAIMNLLKEIQRLGIIKTRPPEAAALIDEICRKLQLSHEVAVEAKRIAAVSRPTNVSPVSLAAASTYVASLRCNEPRTQFVIGKTIGVTPVTIRNLARILE